MHKSRGRISLILNERKCVYIAKMRENLLHCFVKYDIIEQIKDKKGAYI